MEPGSKSTAPGASAAASSHSPTATVFGYLHTVCEMREPTMKKVFCHHGVGVIVEDYAKWLEAKQLKWSSIAYYLAALVSAATFATVEMETPPPLDQLANLRRQAEKMARVRASIACRRRQ